MLGAAERLQIHQRVCHQLHPVVPLLDAFKSEQQPLKFILLGKGSFDTHPQRLDGGVEEAFASAFGRLSVARILCDVGDQARNEGLLGASSEVSTQVQTLRRLDR